MPTQKRKPTLYFVFAAHKGKRTANVLKKVLVRTRRKRQRPQFIGTELSGIKAAEKRELEKKGIGGLDYENTNQINQLATKQGIPIKLIEAARPRQYRKISRMERFSGKFPSNIYKMKFGTATTYTKDSFYRELNQNLARHDEVSRNLKKETQTLAANQTGIVVYGEHHRGLDQFIASKLGVKTARLSERVPYRAIKYEVMEKCISRPKKRKPNENETAQIALEDLLGINFIGFLYEEQMMKRKPNEKTRILFRNLNAIKKLIKSLSQNQIETKWETLRQHKLITTQTIAEKAEKIQELTKLMYSLFGKNQ